MKKTLSCLLAILLLLSCFGVCANAVTNKKLDLAFVIDTTGSMSDDLAQVKTDMGSYLRSLQSSDTDYRIAIVDYRDFPERTGASQDYPYRVQLDFTNEYSAINASINALSLGNGGDGNETIYSALTDGLDSLSWRKNAAKAVILMGDAPALDPEPKTGYTLDATIEKLGGQGVELTEPDEIKFIVVFAVAPSSDSATISFFERLATATGGKCYRASSSTKITEIMDQILSIDIPEISHVFSDWSVQRAATCEEAGLQIRTCSHCDLEETVEIAPLGHDFGEWIALTAPTCTDPGEERRDCSRCDAFETREVPALGHSKTVYFQEASCSEAGFRITLCLRCGESLSSGVLPALPHDWDDGVVTREPTCTEKGVITYTCSGCGETKTEPVDLLAHDWDDGEVTKEPSCTEAGERTFTCAVGGETRTEPIDKLDHEIVLVEGTAPKCVENGLTDGWKCAVCEKWFVPQQEIPATGGHSGGIATCCRQAICSVCKTPYGETDPNAHPQELIVTRIPAREPTCSEEGRTALTYCTGCFTIVQDIETIPATGDHVPGIPATCTEKAVCSVCKRAFGSVDPENHPNIVTDEAKPAGCGSYGLTKGSHCAACMKVIQKQDMIPPTGNHTGGVATCCREAVCSVCKSVYGEKDPKNHQNIVKTYAVAPTCVKTGLTEGAYCADCKAVIKAQQTVPMTSHTIKSVSAPATCTAEGYQDRVICTVCGLLLNPGKAEPARGHNWSDWNYPAGFDCAKGGTAWRTCKVCALQETKKVIPESHAYAVTAKTEPTCTGEGKVIYRCELCGASYSETIPACGHSDRNGDGKCDDCGAKTADGEVCKYCGKVHDGSFGWLTKFFHSILAAFQ